jgi:hypothetical protein
MPRPFLDPARLVSVDATRSFDDLPGLRPNNTLAPLKPTRYVNHDASEDRAMDTYDEYEHRKRIRESQAGRREIQGSDAVFTRAMGWWHNEQVKTALQEEDFKLALGAIKAGQRTFGATDADFRPASGRDVEIKPLDVTDYDSCVDLLVKAESKYTLNPALKGTLHKPKTVGAWETLGNNLDTSSVDSIIQESRTIPSKCGWRENYSWLETTSTVALDEVKTSMDKLDDQNAAATLLQNTVRTYKQIRHLELKRCNKVGIQIWDDIFMRTVKNRNMLNLSLSKVTKRLDILLGDGAAGNRYVSMTASFLQSVIRTIEEKKMVSGALLRLEESLQRTDPKRKEKLDKAAKRMGSPTKSNRQVETGDAEHEEHVVENLIMFLENACQAITSDTTGAVDDVSSTKRAQVNLNSDAAIALLTPTTLKLIVDCMTEYNSDREILCNGLTLLHRIHELVKLKKADRGGTAAGTTASPSVMSPGAVSSLNISGKGPASPPSKVPSLGGMGGLGFKTPGFKTGATFGKKKLLAALSSGGLKGADGSALLTKSAAKKMKELDLEQKFVEEMQRCGGIGAIASALAFRPLLPTEPVTHGIELLTTVAKRLVKAKSGDSIRAVAAQGMVAKLYTQYHVVDKVIPLISHFSRGVCSVSGLLPAMRLASLCISYEQMAAPADGAEAEEEEEEEPEAPDTSQLVDFDSLRGFQKLGIASTANPLFFRAPTVNSVTSADAQKLARVGIRSVVELRPPYAASILAEEAEEEDEALTEVVAGIGMDRATSEGRPHHPLIMAGVGHHEQFTLPSMSITDMLRMVTAGPAGFAEFTRTMLSNDTRELFQLMSHLTLEAHLPCIIHGGGGRKAPRVVMAEPGSRAPPRTPASPSRRAEYPLGCNHGEGKEAVGVVTVLMLMLTNADEKYILQQWCKSGFEGEPGDTEEDILAAKGSSFEMSLRPILQKDGATMAEVRAIRTGITEWRCSEATGRAVMAEIENHFGGAVAYLHEVLGLEMRQIDTLRALISGGHASKGGWLRRGSVVERKAARGKELIVAALSVLEEFDEFAPKEGETFDSDDEDEDENAADNDAGMDAAFKLLRVRVAILQSVSRFLPTLQRQCAEKVKAREKGEPMKANQGDDTQILADIIRLLFKETESQVSGLQAMSAHKGHGGASEDMHQDMIDKLESVFSNLMHVMETAIQQKTLEPTEVVVFTREYLHMRCKQHHANRRKSVQAAADAMGKMQALNAAPAPLSGAAGEEGRPLNDGDATFGTAHAQGLAPPAFFKSFRGSMALAFKVLQRAVDETEEVHDANFLRHRSAQRRASFEGVAVLEKHTPRRSILAGGHTNSSVTPVLEVAIQSIWLLLVIAEQQDPDAFGVAKGKGHITGRSRKVLVEAIELLSKMMNLADPTPWEPPTAVAPGPNDAVVDDADNLEAKVEHEHMIHQVREIRTR